MMIPFGSLRAKKHFRPESRKCRIIQFGFVQPTPALEFLKLED